MNFLDRMISYVNPQAGAKRMRARLIEDTLSRSYDAATFGRRGTGFRGTSSSVNAEIASSGSVLRNRSRDMARNNPYSKRAMKAIASNVVGTGVMPSIMSPSEPAKKKAKKLWKDWAESKKCDFAGKLNFYGMQRLVMRSVAESGEVFIRQRRTDSMAGIPLQLQVLEADFLDTSKDGIRTSNGGFIMQGVEFGADGKIKGYWMFEEHPGEHLAFKSIVSSFVPAEQVIHVFYLERHCQVRGIPFGVSSMLRLKDFGDYEDAKLMQQKIAACFAAFVTDSNDPHPGIGVDEGIPLERVEPGMIEYLPPGKEVTFGNPPTTEGHDEYAKRMLQGVAAGYDVTYEILTQDLSNVNFSSARMGWIEFGKLVKEWQNELIVSQMCHDVWSWFMIAAQITGILPKDITVTWTVPGREMIDPVKEMKGASEKVRNGFDSWQNMTRTMGRDPEEVLNEMNEDQATFSKNGFMLATDPRFDPSRKNFTGEEQVVVPAKQ